MNAIAESLLFLTGARRLGQGVEPRPHEIWPLNPPRPRHRRFSPARPDEVERPVGRRAPRG